MSAQPAPGGVPVTAAARSPRRQRVCVPWRLIDSQAYSDAAVAVYIKVKALGLRPEGCTAGAARIAAYLGMSTSSVERGLAQLRRPDSDGVVELEVRRRTLPGGTGTTAWRQVRPMDPLEHYVWLPVLAAEELTPRELRAYAVIAYSVARAQPLTERDLASHLHHFSGAHAGEALTVWAASELVDVLAAKGWVEVGRRTGHQGRHRFAVREQPGVPGDDHLADPGETVEPSQDEPVDNPVETVSRDLNGPQSSCVGDGSGSCADDGSLVNEESPTTDRPEKNGGAAWSSAVGEVQVGERANAGAPASVPATRGGDTLALRADDTRSTARKPKLAGQEAGRHAPQGYDGPQLTLSPRVWAVLEPVHALIPQVNTYMQRRIAREVGRQLDSGTAAERLHHRLQRRYAMVFSDDIRDAGRWLLGVALPRWGCGHADCEGGVMWTTRTACDTCAEIVADRRIARDRAERAARGLCPDHGTAPGRSGTCIDCDLAAAVGAAPRPPAAERRWWSCGQCEAPAPGAAPPSGLCRSCRTAAFPAEPCPEAAWCCTGCDRTLPWARPEGGLCLACEQRRVTGERRERPTLTAYELCPA